MTAFRAFLILVWIAIVGYTAIVISNHGLGLVGIFFGSVFLATYLLILSWQSQGDMKKVLLGNGRASA